MQWFRRAREASRFAGGARRPLHEAGGQEASARAQPERAEIAAAAIIEPSGRHRPERRTDCYGHALEREDRRETVLAKLVSHHRGLQRPDRPEGEAEQDDVGPQRSRGTRAHEHQDAHGSQGQAKRQQPLRAERLHHAGFDVLLAATGPAALETARRRRPAVTILDRALPGLDGEAVCRALRQDPTTAALLVTMLTPRGRAAGNQRITAFETGADDCVSKPFNPREMVLRVESLLRRARATAPHPTDQLLPADDAVPEAEPPALVETVGPFRIDWLRREVRVDGEIIPFTPTEFHLFRLLVEGRGQPVSRAYLLTEVWGHRGPPSYTRTLDMHVRRVRVRLGRHGQLLVTLRSRGYRLSTLISVRETQG